MNTYTTNGKGTMNATLEPIFDYFEEAVNSIPEDHPHYHEIRRLLISQVNDELHDHDTYHETDRRTG